MIKTKFIPSLTLAVFIAGIGASPFVTASLHADPIHWMKYDEALKKAKQENKHVLVDFATSWCGWCKKMDATTYRDPDVQAAIARNFEAAKVDGDSYNLVNLDDGQITEKGLTRQYGVTGYPTTWFLEPDGTHIAPAPGYVDATAMKYILDFVSLNLNETMAFSDYVAQRKKLESIRPDAKITPGMTEAQVKSLWGEPQSVDDSKDEVLWHYDGTSELVFKNGTLVAYREIEAKQKASN
jgi:uncharacterized protein YyaL (SSP411 family)